MNETFGKTMRAALLAAATLTVTVTSFAQGTIDFSNIKTAGRPRISLWCAPGGTTPEYIAGPDYLVDILVKNPTTGNFEGILKNGAAFTGVAPLTGANAGLFSGGTLVVPFVAPDAKADVKVRAWDVRTGATYASAVYKNEVSFSIDKLGGAGSPPTLPAVLANFTGITFCPEPSTYALGGLGLAVLLIGSKRRKQA
jgi:hypothetical protein